MSSKDTKDHTFNNPSLSLLLLFVTITQISAVHFPINVWPKPTNFHWPHPSFIPLSPTFKISHPTHHHLSSAVSRYRHIITTEHHHPLLPPATNLTSSSPPLTSLIITITDVTSPLTHGVNESYTLTIPPPLGSTTAYLTAQTAWGAMHGLETFSQLVYNNPPRVAAGVEISDEPIFKHRGVVLDTSRNYYGVEHLLRLIRAMSMNKMNVFHWHITDSHSFPLILPSEPELAGRGAYGEDMKYSVEDVKKIVHFGMEHGVRVLPEIDMPGEYHSSYFILFLVIRFYLGK
ncbi:glycosidase [Lithospermum erythrorhizon]|uniref:beta-N-acetylhexosaminidase n=1 Tax=Lithospermum erythrorhizon TaxID=34254 RepID=A0AAV3QQY2_LITER